MTAHAMPFGAAVLPQGGVRFRLWAPKAKEVRLVLDGREMPMKGEAEGWFEIVDRQASAGSLYRYRIDGGMLVPDPASRFQPQDVDGPSEVIDAAAFRWSDGDWSGRPWREAVIYEAHVGCFTETGSYASFLQKIPDLKRTGITAIELMPLADFGGRRNWGYDGVLPYAPDSAYGRPDDLKRLVQAAHQAGLMVFLDVVYNHFGPKGNYLGVYAPQFFTERHRTPWGAAIDFGQRWVREYFIHNTLYWLEEYRFDGLRFDAVHAIVDESPKHLLVELAERVRERFPGKHLILENDANQARYLAAGRYDAQWNDDSHHAYHVLATGEDDGYYISYVDAPARHLARCLAEGFAYQGEVSRFSGEKRGEPSAHLAPAAFVDFMQNHDQVGNRALGERLLSLANEKKLKTLSAILLLAPSPPMLFMGEEWGCRQPFLFFCDFDGELGEAVRSGRRNEFKRFASFEGEVPDPLAEETFRRCVLRWEEADPAWLEHTRALLDLRRREIAAREFRPGAYTMHGERAFSVRWPGASGEALVLLANCGDEAVRFDLPSAGPLWTNGAAGAPWTVCWHLS